jgi:OOP family OmpA-OmpF porin
MEGTPVVHTPRPRLVTVLAVALLATAALTAAAPSARAQSRDNFTTPTYDIQLWRPAVDSRGYVTVNSSRLMGHLDFSLGLLGTYAFQPLRMQLGSGEPYGGMAGMMPVLNSRTLTVEHLVTPTLQFTLGLFKWVEVGIGVPIGIMFGRRQLCQGNTDECGGFSMAMNSDQLKFSQVFVGDLAVNVKGRILDPGNFPLGLGYLIQVYLPISKWADNDGHRAFIGEGNVTLRPQLIVEREWGSSRRFRTAINVGALVRFQSSTFTDIGKSIAVGSNTLCYPADTTVTMGACSPGTTFGGTGLSRSLGTQVTYSLGLSFAVVQNKFDVLAEAFGYADVTGNERSYPLEVLGALKVYLAKNSFFLAGAGAGVIGNGGAHTGSPLARAFLGFVYDPRIGDRDGDGIKDNVDQCPDEPEDLDGFQDQDGCPEPDNDNDGIPDSKDACPNVPGVWEKQGCPIDADRDGDGIPDSRDKCPDDPEDRDGFQDDDGCPELDNDGDGIPDNDDKCPDEAETKNNFQDDDGCPDGADRDKDGIPDEQDKCPDNAEDKDGFEDQDGCPDPDNDKDRIPDKFDKCPNEPETYNGHEDEDGCPDKGRVMVTSGKIEILDKVYFDTGKSTIKAVSFPILDAVAATLNGNPNIELVEIQGHADERGNDNANLRLTQSRVESVRDYLVKKGVDKERLQPKGYGETKPVCTESNEPCWEKNRRVEFVILKPALEGGSSASSSSPPPPDPPAPAKKGKGKKK